MHKAMLILLTIMGTAPASAEVLDVGKHGFTVSNSRTVKAPVSRAWSALVNDIGRWWSAEHSWFGDARKLSIDARAGGCFCEIDGRRQVKHMEVTHVDPGVLLRLSGALGPLRQMGLNGVMDFAFVESEGQLRIQLRYRAGGYTPGSLSSVAQAVDRVLAEQLERLVLFTGG